MDKKILAKLIKEIYPSAVVSDDLGYIKIMIDNIELLISDIYQGGEITFFSSPFENVDTLEIRNQTKEETISMIKDLVEKTKKGLRKCNHCGRWFDPKKEKSRQSSYAGIVCSNCLDYAVWPDTLGD